MKPNTDIPYTLDEDSVLTLGEAEELFHKMATVLFLEVHSLLNKSEVPFRKEPRPFPTAADMAVARALIIQKAMDDETPPQVVHAQLDYVHQFVFKFLIEITQTKVPTIELIATLAALNHKMKKDEPRLRKAYDRAMAEVVAERDGLEDEDDLDDETMGDVLNALFKDK